jgi:hypothetical protein
MTDNSVRHVRWFDERSTSGSTASRSRPTLRVHEKAVGRISEEEQGTEAGEARAIHDFLLLTEDGHLQRALAWFRRSICTG